MVDMNKIADKLEDKYLVQQTEEAKEILAFVQFYRIQCALAESSDENNGLHKHIVSGSLPATHIWLKANELRPDLFMKWYYKNCGNDR